MSDFPPLTPSEQDNVVGRLFALEARVDALSWVEPVFVRNLASGQTTTTTPTDFVSKSIDVPPWAKQVSAFLGGTANIINGGTAQIWAGTLKISTGSVQESRSLTADIPASERTVITTTVVEESSAPLFAAGDLGDTLTVLWNSCFTNTGDTAGVDIYAVEGFVLFRGSS